MVDWLKPPQRDIALVYGPASTTLGYYELEEASRANALETLSQHPRETELWYRALTLHLEILRGRWTPLSGDGSKKQWIARNAQIDLLALALCSSKTALDAILAGYYSMGWAASRHCVETALRCLYLEDLPDAYRYLYDTGDNDTKQRFPSASQVRNQIKKHYKNDNSPGARTYVAMVEDTYKVFELMNAGSHPSGEGIVQLQDIQESGSRYWGSNYRYDLTMVSFDNGLSAVGCILTCYYLVRAIDPAWTHQFRQWQSDVSTWRGELRHNERLAHFSTHLIPGSPSRGDS